MWLPSKNSECLRTYYYIPLTVFFPLGNVYCYIQDLDSQNMLGIWMTCISQVIRYKNIAGSVGNCSTPMIE